MVYTVWIMLCTHRFILLISICTGNSSSLCCKSLALLAKNSLRPLAHTCRPSTLSIHREEEIRQFCSVEPAGSSQTVGRLVHQALFFRAFLCSANVLSLLCGSLTPPIAGVLDFTSIGTSIMSRARCRTRCPGHIFRMKITFGVN